MKRRRVVQLTALGGLTLPLAGCTEEAADDGNETANGTDTDTETSADGDGDDEGGDEDDESADEPEDQEFSGSGDETIEDVTIDGGLTVVDATYEGDGGDSDEDGGDESDGDDDEGDSEFEVRLIPEERLAEGDDNNDGDDSDGDDDADGRADTETEQNATDEDTQEDADEEGENADDESEDAESVVFVRSAFVDPSGEYEGRTAHPVDEGTYALNVVADGDWEVTVSQPRDESGDELPISIDGSGNEVHGPFEFDGSHQPSGEYDGERIVANVYSATGDTLFVFNENSIANPSEFEFEGVGYLSVKSDDEWTIEIE